MKNIVAVALAVVFVLALAVPAFAMTHSVTYDMDGVIEYKRQAGHACNTGGVHKQTIVGEGEMQKVSAIAMVPGKLTMSDHNDYVAGAAGLTVTSVIELCMPPKYVYEGDGPAVTTGAGVDNTPMNWEAPVAWSQIYNVENHPMYMGRNGHLSGITHEYLAAAHGWEALTDQIWAVQVAADPGFSGNLHQDFTAAEGPYWGHPADGPFANNAPWECNDHTWRRELDGDGCPFRSPGDNYVGSFFDIAQTARTSMGEVKRYIDVSSPFSGAYLMEDMSVVGKSEIEESFNMTNVAPGADVPGEWWDLF